MLLEEVRRAFAFHDLIANVESDSNQFAMRFEKRFFDELKRGIYDVSEVAKLNKCSVDTAYAICSISWGLYQILGWNIYYLCGYKKDIVSFLNNKNEQMWAFERFIDKRMKRAFLFFANEVMLQLQELSDKIERNGLGYLKSVFSGESSSKYDAVRKFVELYNGSRAGSDAFVFYVKRMLKYLGKALEKYELRRCYDA